VVVVVVVVVGSVIVQATLSELLPAWLVAVRVKVWFPGARPL
jgi:hypothetical protein